MDRRSIAACIVGALALALVLFVSSSATVSVWHDPPSPRANTDVEVEPDALDEVEPAGDPGLLGPPPQAETNENIAFRIVAVLVFAGLLYLAYIVISFWIRAFTGRERRVEVPDAPFVTLPDVDGPPLMLDAEALDEALRRGPARNAIVACWMQLEDDVAAAGLPRRPAETSAEFTTRVVAGASIDPGPIGDLAALYREARFSHHDLGEPQRQLAMAALGRVHDSLAAADRPSGAR